MTVTPGPRPATPQSRHTSDSITDSASAPSTSTAISSSSMTPTILPAAWLGPAQEAAMTKSRSGEKYQTRRGAGDADLGIGSTADLVLLCAFGPDLSAERTASQLRAELLAEGFTAAAARHLIRASGLLERPARNRYRLRRGDPAPGDRDAHSATSS